MIELMPDMCSLTLSSLNFMNQSSMNEPSMIQQLAKKMKEYGVTPELECFDLGMINYGKYLINKGIIQGPKYWNLLFGNIAGFQASLSHISAAINELDATDIVGLGGLGKFQLSVNSLAISMGLGVRVGIEDNIWWDMDQTKKCTNIDLVKRIHTLMEVNQKEFWSAQEFGSLGFYNQNRK